MSGKTVDLTPEQNDALQASIERVNSEPLIEVGELVEEGPCRVEIDGVWYDGETGEVVGFADAPSPSQGSFLVESEEHARWVLRKIRAAEAAAVAALNDPEMLAARATIAAGERIAERAGKRAESLRKRFEPELRLWAEIELASRGKKAGRSVELHEGTIKLTAKKGGLRVTNAQIALMVAREEWPEAVATKVEERFLVSKLSPEHEAELIEGLRSRKWADDDRIYETFAVEPDTTVVKIETGVKLS